MNSYKSLFSGKDSVIVTKAGKLEDFILGIVRIYAFLTFNETCHFQYKSLPAAMNENYIIGATIDKVKSTAWFNPNFPHSLPLSLNILNRAILKQHSGDDYDISLVNKPFQMKRENETLDDAKTRRVSLKHL